MTKNQVKWFLTCGRVPKFNVGQLVKFSNDTPARKIIAIRLSEYLIDPDDPDKVLAFIYDFDTKESEPEYYLREVK